MESNFLEKIIIKGCMTDPNFVANLSGVFDADYFDNPQASNIYKTIVKHFTEYKTIPQKSIIINEAGEEVNNFIDEIHCIDFDVAANYDYLFNNTNEYLKEKAVKKAILSSVNVINNDPQNIQNIRKIIEDALCKDLKIDLGHNYFKDFKQRIEKILTSSNIRVPTYYPIFDEYLGGGFPPFTLSLMIAKIHGQKSSFLANISSRMVIHGKNVVLSTLEMAEEAFAQRFDAIFTLQDINRLYKDTRYTLNLINKIGELNEQGVGNLYIKQFPTGKATVGDFRKYLRELIIRGIKPDIFICDYLNLMKPEYKSRGDMYSDVKAISEELRALSFEFSIPVVSVSQLNREGMNVSFEEVNFNYISESIGVLATCDFATIFGDSEERMIYESELFYKIVKNRLGGRVGDIDKFYHDQRTLKIYDSSELELWMRDAEISGDNRRMAEVQDRTADIRGSRSRNRR